MPVTHVNRYRDMYYLHVGRTKTGKPRYWFSTKADGDLVDAIPEGYEVYENPDARVYLRKKPPQIVTPEEVAVVKHGLERYAAGQKCIVDVRKEVETRKRTNKGAADKGKRTSSSTIQSGATCTRKCCGSRWMTRRTGLSESSVGVSRGRSTTGSIYGSPAGSGSSRISSGTSAPTSGRTRSTS